MLLPIDSFFAFFYSVDLACRVHGNMLKSQGCGSDLLNGILPRRPFLELRFDVIFLSLKENIRPRAGSPKCHSIVLR